MAYWGWHPLFNPADAVTHNVDKDLAGEMRVEIDIRYDLNKLGDGQVRRKLELALQRGYLTSTSGKAFKVYCLLAAAFDFPIFCLGAGGYIILSYEAGDADATRRVQEVIEQAKVLMKLADPKGYIARPGFGPGHNERWRTAQFTRPTKMTDQGMCAMLGVKSLGELGSKENRTRALQALIKGEQLAIRRL